MIEAQEVKDTAKTLWEHATQRHSALGTSDLRGPLQTFDAFLMQEMVRVFGDPRTRLSIDEQTYRQDALSMRIGYSNDPEIIEGLKYLQASWDDWIFRVELFDFQGYHRLDNVRVAHKGLQVNLQYPMKYVGKFIPSGISPTDLEVVSVKAA